MPLTPLVLGPPASIIGSELLQGPLYIGALNLRFAPPRFLKPSSAPFPATGAYMGEERRRIGEPSWQPLDSATVEALVGEPLEEG
jgi:hypothetical protein